LLPQTYVLAYSPDNRRQEAENRDLVKTGGVGFVRFAFSDRTLAINDRTRTTTLRSCTPELANMLHCAKVSSMRQTEVHIGFTGAHDRALMSEVFAMQCMNASAGLLAENPMSRRNDAYTAIFYFRYC